MNEWDSYADDWDDDPYARAYATAALGSLRRVLERCGRTLADMRVVDFGCGTGLLTELLVEEAEHIHAVDSSEAMLAQLTTKISERGWPNVSVSQELPATSESYDLVVCSSVLSFVDDYPATVARLVGHLAPGGVFVQWDWERDDTDEDPHGFAREEIADTLHAAGFASVEVGVAFEVEVEGATMRPLLGSGQVPT